MITYHKEYGCWFQLTEDSKHYCLYEMKTYKHNSTSDIIAIFDHDNDAFVNHVYGATIISVDELDKIVTEYVKAYEAKTRAQATPKIKYPFNKVGISAFMNDVADDILEREICGDFRITHGKRALVYPDTAECWDALARCLDDALEEWEA